jgi:hypothetical protein
MLDCMYPLPRQAPKQPLTLARASKYWAWESIASEALLGPLTSLNTNVVEIGRSIPNPQPQPAGTAAPSALRRRSDKQHAHASQNQYAQAPGCKTYPETPRANRSGCTPIPTSLVYARGVADTARTYNSETSMYKSMSKHFGNTYPDITLVRGDRWYTLSKHQPCTRR